MIENDINQPGELFFGELIEEKCSVGQLCDNRLYLLTDEESSLALKANGVIDNVRNVFVNEGLFNNYTLECAQYIELSNHPLISERIKDGNNFILQLNTPLKANKTFIVACLEEDDLMISLCMIIREAEQISKQEFSTILKQFAIDNIEEFEAISKEAENDQGFFAGYFANLENEVMDDTYCMAASTSFIKAKLDIEGSITHKQRTDVFNRLFDNLKTYRKHKDPKIEAELNLVFNSIDPATWMMFFLKQSPQLQEKMSNLVNPQMQAQTSTMDLEIRKADHIDKKNKNDGYYRLYLNREDETLKVHFSRKNGFVLYVIYLLDRKMNGDKVDTLDIRKYRDLFSKIYEMTYGISGAKTFDEMINHFDANGDVKQRSINTVLDSIRKDVGSTCERMQEPPDAYLLKDNTYHLAVLPKHIILPKEFITLV